MIRTFLKMRGTQRAFEKAVTPGIVETILRDGAERQPFTQARIEYVLAFVRGENLSEISERVAAVADIATATGGLVDNLIGALVIVAFGTRPASVASQGSRSLLVDTLRKHLGKNVKIVHGAADGHCGLFGSQKRISYTFLVPNFDAVLGTLSRIEFGQIEEFRQ